MIPDDLENTLNNWNIENIGRIKPKCIYIIPTGSNPTGISMNLTRKQEIYNIAMNHGLLILEDDPYYYMQYPESRTPSFYSLDKDNGIYRPCRNPKKKYDRCRPNANTYNYKCLEGREQEYKSEMELLEETLQLEKKQDDLDSEIRSRIGKIYGTSVRNTSLHNLQMYVLSFPSRDIENDYLEVDFSKFKEEFLGQITESVNREIDKEIQENRAIIGKDQDLLYLYNVFKNAEIYKRLADTFDSMYKSSEIKFLDRFGNKTVIEELNRRQRIRELREIERAKRLAEQARLKREQEKLEKEEEKLYMEADLQKPYSPQGIIKDEPGQSVKKKSITSKDVKSGDISKKSIISSPSSVSTVVSQYSLHGNKL